MGATDDGGKKWRAVLRRGYVTVTNLCALCAYARLPSCQPSYRRDNQEKDNLSFKVQVLSDDT